MTIAGKGLRPMVLLWAAACGTAPKPGGSLTRDSAGVQIVENPAPASAEPPWVLDTVPALDLGNQPTDPTQEFSQYVQPFRLADGRLVVANGGTGEIRFFGPDGHWLKTVGRKGSGPGEFGQLGWLDVAAGDTIRAFDWDARRVTVLAGDGTVQRMYLLTATGPASAPRPVAVLGDGRLIALGQSFVTPGSKAGAGRDTMPLYAADGSGLMRDSLGRVAGPERVIATEKNSVMVTRLPFGKDLSVAARGDRIYLGTADRPEVAVLNATGAPVRLIRWTAPPVPVTQADIDQYLATFAAGFQPGQEAMRDRFTEIARRSPFPKMKPAYAGIRVAPDGSLWVERYTQPDQNAPTVFDVFDSGGQWLGTVPMPARFGVTQIGDGFVVGTWKDEDDATHVRLYRMTRKGR